jgi:hypothetical protein
VAMVAMVACGISHTLVVTRAGRRFGFALGYIGQLGLGDTNNRDVPAEVGPGRFGGAIIIYAAACDAHSGVVTSGGAVWTRGCRRRGRLGVAWDPPTSKTSWCRGSSRGSLAMPAPSRWQPGVCRRGDPRHREPLRSPKRKRAGNCAEASEAFGGGSLYILFLWGGGYSQLVLLKRTALVAGALTGMVLMAGLSFLKSTLRTRFP